MIYILYFLIRQTVDLLILKRARDRFPLFVSKRDCVQIRKFPGCTTLLTVDRYWPFVRTVMTVIA